MNRRSFLLSLGKIAALATAVKLPRWGTPLGGPAPTVISNIPTGPAGVVARKIYRSNGNGTFKLVATILDNTTRSWTDAPQTGAYKYAVVDQLQHGDALLREACAEPINVIDGDTVTIQFSARDL